MEVCNVVSKPLKLSARLYKSLHYGKRRICVSRAITKTKGVQQFLTLLCCLLLYPQCNCVMCIRT